MARRSRQGARTTEALRKSAGTPPTALAARAQEPARFSSGPAGLRAEPVRRTAFRRTPVRSDRGRSARPAKVRSSGGAPLRLRLPRHHGSSTQLASLYPFQLDEGLGPAGLCMGLDVLSGGAFYFDPFSLYSAGVLDNPNLMIFGEPGAGKSSLVKTLLARNLGLLGKGSVPRQAFVIDPKNEYGPLARFLDMTVLALRPGGQLRLNPLAVLPGSVETPAQSCARRTRLVVALLSCVARRALSPLEDALVGWAMEVLTDTQHDGAASDAHRARARATRHVTLAGLAELMLAPSVELARRAERDRQVLEEEARPVWVLLDRLLRRDLAGMLDGEEDSAASFSSSATGVVLDVSAVFSDKDLLRLVMLGATSYLQSLYTSGSPGPLDGGPFDGGQSDAGQLDTGHFDTGHFDAGQLDAGPSSWASGDRESGGPTDELLVPRRLFVVDECWSLLNNEEATRFLQESWKLSRRYGVANIAICHRVADLGAQADAGSALQKIGSGLLADSQTQVLFRTHQSALEVTREALGLSELEAECVTRLHRARALWRIRGASMIVDHVRSAAEASFSDTDERLLV